mgnify:CR=1 FL=1
MGELRPIDDLMFRVMARDKAFCGELLGVLLNVINLSWWHSHRQGA